MLGSERESTGENYEGSTLSQGSYRVLNSWKIPGNLPSNFPDLEKVWKIEIKSGKSGKKSGVLFFFKATTNVL